MVVKFYKVVFSALGWVLLPAGLLLASRAPAKAALTVTSSIDAAAMQERSWRRG